MGTDADRPSEHVEFKFKSVEWEQKSCFLTIHTDCPLYYSTFLHLTFSPCPEVFAIMLTFSGSTSLFSEPMSINSHYLRTFADHITAQSELVEKN